MKASFAAVCRRNAKDLGTRWLVAGEVIWLMTLSLRRAFSCCETLVGLFLLLRVLQRLKDNLQGRRQLGAAKGHLTFPAFAMTYSTGNQFEMDRSFVFT